jgi:hypothetical protein
MGGTLGALRRLALVPSMATVTFARRGFPIAPGAQVSQLEAIPQAVICGLEWGLETSKQWELERRLEMVQAELRGFAYEGAAMATTIRDVMAGGRGRRTRELLLGPGHQHIFLAYIGIGFAMSRIPKALWRHVLPDLHDSPYHPIMSWLAVDGYGFDRAYFDTERWIVTQRVPAHYPWQDAPAYFPRAFDQGAGRALWFIHGGRPDSVAEAVGRFAKSRQSDLWSGVGVAATYAGGPYGIAGLRAAAGEHWSELALGSIFAAKARSHAGHMPTHCESAVNELAGVTGKAAVVIADNTKPRARDTSDMSSQTDTPDYELWRQKIRSRLVANELAAGSRGADYTGG